jgi:hypothetical protein
MGVSLSRFPFTTAMWVVDRIHHNTAHVRASAQPSHPTSLPNINILMIRIPNLPDSGHARRENFPHFT